MSKDNGPSEANACATSHSSGDKLKAQDETSQTRRPSRRSAIPFEGIMRPLWLPPKEVALNKLTHYAFSVSLVQLDPDSVDVQICRTSQFVALGLSQPVHVNVPFSMYVSKVETNGIFMSPL